MQQVAQVARPGPPRVTRGVGFRTGPGPRTPTDSQPSYTHMGPARSGLANGCSFPSKRGPPPHASQLYVDSAWAVRSAAAAALDD
jgi:hypothetical protein